MSWQVWRKYRKVTNSRPTEEDDGPEYKYDARETEKEEMAIYTRVMTTYYGEGFKQEAMRYVGAYPDWWSQFENHRVLPPYWRKEEPQPSPSQGRPREPASPPLEAAPGAGVASGAGQRVAGAGRHASGACMGQAGGRG